MKKTLLIAGLALLALLVVAGVLLWYFMQQPLYTPGMVRAGEDLRAALNPPAQGADPDFWTVEPDIRLFHFADGTGANVLVVHGGPGMPPHHPWPGLKLLTEDYRFTYYHQRGCGQSTRPLERFTSSNMLENMKVLDRTLGLGAQIADIERIRRILGEEKLLVLGHSFGAFLASLYAAEFPERVRALVLVAPANVLVMPAEGSDLFAEVGKALPESMKNDYNAFVKDYLDFSGIFEKSDAELAEINMQFAKFYTEAAKAKGFSLPEQTAGDNGGWMVYGMYFSMGRRHDYRTPLRTVTAPVLVIHGETDLLPEEVSRAYTQVFPNSRFRVTQGAGHFPFHDRPEEFAAAVGEFLDGLK